MFVIQGNSSLLFNAVQKNFPFAVGLCIFSKCSRSSSKGGLDDERISRGG